MSQLLTITMIFFSLYAIIPTILLWSFFGGLKQGSSLNPYITLTFENGPDPELTPKYLELLNSLGIKATFFLNGQKAEQYPTLVQEIVQDGHELGYQNYSSFSNWFLSPRKSYQQMKRTVALLQQASGTSPVYYRPPKGRVNLYQLWQASRRHASFALWSISLYSLTISSMNKVIGKARNGSIIRIDGGGSAKRPEDLQRTLQLFAKLLADLSRRGFQFLTLDQLYKETREDRAIKEQLRSSLNYLFFRIWKKWESMVHRILKLEYVYTDRSSIFRIKIRRYHGKSIQMADGQWLNKGDKIGELHLNNELFIQSMQSANSPLQLAASMIRMAKESFPILSQFVVENEKYHDIKAIYGITMIYRGADPLGFKVEAMPDTMFTRMTTLYLRLYMIAMHPTGKKRLKKNRDKLVPKRVLMSREELVRRYFPQATGIVNRFPG